MAATWSLIAAGLLLAIFAVLALWAQKSKKRSADYYSLFLAGVVWLLFGIAMQSASFLAMGLIFLSAGLAHKSEWKKTCAPIGHYANYAIALGVIVAFIVAVYFFWQSPESKAKQFCGKENVAAVRVCGGYAEVVSSLLGGGSAYYRGGTIITCPVVAPDSMSLECKTIYEAKLNSSIICKDVCIKATDFESCAAAGYPVTGTYPRRCAAGGTAYIEKISEFTECMQEQRNADVCTAIYASVCAKVNVQCIRAPCNPVNETFPNSCEACKNPSVGGYWQGACE